MANPSRHLAAILFTDIVGYSLMMQQDESNAVMLNHRYTSLLRKCVSEYDGEIVNDYGDGSLCTFSSATSAIRCAMELQNELKESPKVPLRVGLHIGEILFDQGKVFGDGVNIASRIQSLGIANSILFSSEIYSKIKSQSEFKCVSLGRFKFKNIEESQEVFALANDGFTVPDRKKIEGKLDKKGSSKKIPWVVAAGLVILLAAGFLVYRMRNQPSGFSSGGQKTIAVLPFENIGADSSEEYVSDGITQDIINNLSKISSLQKVIGWFSVKSLKKTSKSVKEIATQLDVAAILSGTIERQADKTHVVAELIEVSTNKRLWGEDFEYDSKDLVSIQSKVATEIVTALKANLTPEEKKTLTKHYTENVDAYKYYIRGRTFWNGRGRINFDSAETNFKKAIGLDKDYALAYAGIADCYLYNHKGMPQLEAIPIARAYAKQALDLDSTLSEGLTSLGFIQYNFDFNWDLARKTLEKAISIDPNNSIAHLYYGNLLQFTGETEKGLAEARKSVELEPLAYSTNWVLGRNYYFAGKIQESIEQLNRLVDIAPKVDQVYWSLAYDYLTLRKYDEAMAEFKRMPPESDNPIDNLFLVKAYADAVVGNKAEAEANIQRGLKSIKPSVYRLAEVYVALGDHDKALNYLEQGYVDRDLHMFWLKVDPAFGPIRENPRFRALLAKMNLH